MPIYRFKQTGAYLPDLQDKVPGSPSIGNIGPGIYVDITVGSGNFDDLVDYMSTQGYTYISTNPVTTVMKDAAANYPSPTAGTDVSNKDYVYFSDLLNKNPVEPDATYSLTRIGGRVTQEQWRRTSDSSLLKQVDYTYTQTKVTGEVRKVYATDGVTVVAQLTIVYTYTSGIFTGQTTTRDI